MSDQAPSKASRSELRLWLQAIRNDWDIPAAKLEEIKSAAIAATLTGSTREQLAGAEVLIAIYGKTPA
ncbi:hypothetical protein [Schlesneria sp. T3-172]|uniref:hypothetical protein n=1 Tax=Schlesneria sphaerica TaxID=3373610 RepID=UPI0037C706BA